MIRLDATLTDCAARIGEVILRHTAALEAGLPENIRQALLSVDVAVLWSLSQSRENQC